MNQQADIFDEPLAPSGRELLHRLRPLGLLAALPLAMMATGSFIAPAPTSQAAVPVSRAMQSAIGAMSTGADQSLVVSGTSAVERNAEIPLTDMARGTMAAFHQIAPGSAAYGNALKCMTQAIYYEAANEPEAGKLAVAQVVLNRVRHPAFPRSVCGVVYQGVNAPVCQFSFTCDGSLLRKPMVRQWAESERIAREALAGRTSTQVGAATNYHADYVVPKWAFTLGKLGQIGRHIFYRLPGSIGDARVFTSVWSGIEHIPALDFNRLRARLAARDEVSAELALAPTDQFVPGLTVTPDVKDRHAANDVGGRLDTTTGFTLSIPDPTQASTHYRNALAGQGDALHRVATSAPAPTPSRSSELTMAAPGPTQGERN